MRYAIQTYFNLARPGICHRIRRHQIAVKLNWPAEASDNS
jgi:hypothetical protein